MILRLAKKEELNTIYNIYQEMKSINECTWDETYPCYDNILEDYEAKCLYVYLNNNEILGVVSVVNENELDNIIQWKVNDGTHKEIARIAVKRIYQGKGIAKDMLKQLFVLLKEKNTHTIHLLVAKINNRAINLYKKLGFAFLGECYMYEEYYFICEKVL